MSPGNYERTPAIRRKGSKSIKAAFQEARKTGGKLGMAEPGRAATKRQLVAMDKGRELGRKVARFCHDTKKQRRASRRNIKIAIKVAATLPRTEKQFETLRRTIKIAQAVSHSLPKTSRQIRSARESGRKNSKYGLAALRKLGRFRSKVEIKFSNLLKRQLPYLECDFFIPETLYRGDIVNTRNLRIVEIDGAYWHKKHKRHDRIRDWKLQDLGWEILHLPANEKYLFLEDTVDVVLDFLSTPRRFPRPYRFPRASVA